MKKYKLTVTDGFAVNPGDLSWSLFEKYCDIEVFDKLPQDMVAESLEDSDFVFTNRIKIDKKVLDRARKLKLISAMGTGYDMIDVIECRKRGIEVCNIPGYSTDSVAQTALMLLISLAFDIRNYQDMARNGQWTGVPGFYYPQFRFEELAGKTIGIYGFGQIGSKFAGICRALGMKVLATSRSRTEGSENGVTFCMPELLISNSDYISFHCPLTDQTRGLVNSSLISKMKDGVCLINTSRGAVFNEHDVAEALKSGKIRGCGVDVLAAEPALPDNPLLGCDNCIITPHCAWTSYEARCRLMEMLEENIESYIETGKGKYRV